MKLFFLSLVLSMISYSAHSKIISVQRFGNPGDRLHSSGFRILQINSQGELIESTIDDDRGKISEKTLLKTSLHKNSVIAIEKFGDDKDRLKVSGYKITYLENESRNIVEATFYDNSSTEERILFSLPVDIENIVSIKSFGDPKDPKRLSGKRLLHLDSKGNMQQTDIYSNGSRGEPQTLFTIESSHIRNIVSMESFGDPKDRMRLSGYKIIHIQDNGSFAETIFSNSSIQTEQIAALEIFRSSSTQTRCASYFQ